VTVVYGVTLGVSIGLKFFRLKEFVFFKMDFLGWQPKTGQN
jgi:hypothetical protein